MCVCVCVWGGVRVRAGAVERERRRVVFTRVQASLTVCTAIRWFKTWCLALYLNACRLGLLYEVILISLFAFGELPRQEMVGEMLQLRSWNTSLEAEKDALVENVAPLQEQIREL
eukprot:COSAG02_NODE_13873_length_1336_cov_14.654810_1_plen_114_part_10